MLSLMIVLCVLDEYGMLEGATDIYILQVRSLRILFSSEE